MREALELHYDQIKAIANVRYKIVSKCAQKDIKVDHDDDAATRLEKVLYHAQARKVKVNRFCKQLKKKYGLFEHSQVSVGNTNPLLE